MQRDQLTTPERASIEADQQRPTQGNAGIPSEPTELVDMGKPISVNADAAAPREGGDIDSQGSGSGSFSFSAAGADRENENETRPDRGWQRVGDVARRLVADLKVASGG